MILSPLLFTLTGCAHMTPPVAIIAAPDLNIIAAPVAAPPPGSLWTEVGTRALIGADGNARRVGDLITVNIEDTSSTSLGADTSTSRAGSADFNITAALGLDQQILGANPSMGANIGLGGESTSTHVGTGSTSRQGSLAATITCQVQEVLPNGNLRVRGTKQVKVNRETQFLTIEGIVRPRDILLDNTVRSDLIAEARIEFTGAGVLADKQGPGWATRIADTVWPF